MAAELPKPGDVLSDRYDVIRVVGEGGMGVVYEGTHRRIGQRVAIKVLHPQMISAPDFVERFEREARAAGRLKSRHSVRVMDVDVTADGLPYMVMEFLEGRDLEKEIQARGALPIDEAVDYLWQTCGAMAEAHDAGIIHRDLKPANLFLCHEEGRAIVKILDFGISKMTRDTSFSVSITTATASVGTPLYMSPEQVRSSKSVDARTDIWSLGVIAYELLAGKLPFPHESSTALIAAIVTDDPVPLRTVRPDVPPDLERVVHTALQKDVERRYPDVRSLAIALGPFIRNGPVSMAGGVNSTDDDAFAPTLAPGQTGPSRPTQPPPLQETGPAAATRVPVARLALSTPSWSIEPRRGGGRLLVPIALIAACLVAAGVYLYPRAPTPEVPTVTATSVIPPVPASAAVSSPPSPLSAPSSLSTLPSAPPAPLLTTLASAPTQPRPLRPPPSPGSAQIAPPPAPPSAVVKAPRPPAPPPPPSSAPATVPPTRL